MQAQSENKQVLLQRMRNGAELVQDWDVVADSDFMEVLCKPICKTTSWLIDVQGRAERARYAIDDTGEISNTEGTVMRSSENVDIRNLGASVEAAAGTGEQKVTKTEGSFEGGEKMCKIDGSD